MNLFKKSLDETIGFIQWCIIQEPMACQRVRSVLFENLMLFKRFFDFFYDHGGDSDSIVSHSNWNPMDIRLRNS